MTLRERVARALCVAEMGKDCDPDFMTYEPFADLETDPPTWPRWKHWENQADAIIPLILSEAAKVAMEKGDQWHKEWRAGHKSSSHIEGKSDGADEIASAIEALA